MVRGACARRLSCAPAEAVRSSPGAMALGAHCAGGARAPCAQSSPELNGRRWQTLATQPAPRSRANIQIEVPILATRQIAPRPLDAAHIGAARSAHRAHIARRTSPGARHCTPVPVGQRAARTTSAKQSPHANSSSNSKQTRTVGARISAPERATKSTPEQLARHQPSGAQVSVTQRAARTMQPQ